MKRIIIEVNDDFPVKELDQHLDSYYGVEIKEVIELSFKGRECPICHKKFEDLLAHFRIDHDIKSMDELKERLGGAKK